MKLKSFTQLLLILSFGLFINTNLRAQAEAAEDTAAPKHPKIVVGLGVGMLNYYGDIGYKKASEPWRFKAGYQIDVQKNFNRNWGLDFYFMGGNVYGEENTIDRNLNFKSRLFTEALMLRYNFCPKDENKKALVTPFVGIGLGYLSYTTKSDLLDANGVRYNYWNDGSIRTLPQAESNTLTAVQMDRDYTYETEVGSGNSLFIPLQIGFKCQMTPNIFVRLQTTFNMTMTNQIDYVQVNQFTGNHSYDNYLFSAITLNYDFGAGPKGHNQARYKDVDYKGMETIDSDGDGVPDIDDICPETPKGVPVDKHGCPLDSDGDGILDYLDKEPNSPKDARVDADGVALPSDYGTDLITVNRIPEELRVFDINEDYIIDSTEISKAIDSFFDSNGGIKKEQIYKLIDYFFDQKDQ